MHLELLELAELSNHVAIALDRISRKSETNLSDTKKMSDWLSANLSFSTPSDISKLLTISRLLGEEGTTLHSTLKAIAATRCILEDILLDADFVRDHYPEVLKETEKFFASLSEAFSAELPAIHPL